MRATPLQLLVIEDSADDAELLRLELDRGGMHAEMRVIDQAAHLQTALNEKGWDLVISDHNLLGFDSFAALKIVRDHDRNIPFIVVSGSIGEEQAVEVMQAGADDYIMKGRLARLLPAIERSLREAQVRTERREALQRLEENEARLRVLTANVPCLMVQIVRHGDGTLSVPYADGRLRELFALREGGVIDAEALFAPFGRQAKQFKQLFFDNASPQDELFATGCIDTDGGIERWINFRARRRLPSSDAVVWEGAFFDTSEQKRIENEVRDLNNRLQELAARVNLSREGERSRIARELHDDLGGSLTALKIEMVMLRNQADITDPASEGRLAQMISQVDEIVGAVRRICADLHPKILDELGLAAALQWQTERFSSLTGLSCDYEAEVDPELPKGVAIALFRIYQEILTNIARHAQASQVLARLRQSDHQLELDVSDDGVGIDSGRAARRDAFGLFNMQQRTAEIGGHITIAPGTPQGTRVLIVIPLSATSHPTSESTEPGPAPAEGKTL